MMIFTLPHQCIRTEIGSPFVPTLAEFPNGKKTKWYNEWFYLKEEKIYGKDIVKIYESKSGKKLKYESLPEYMNIEED